MKTSLLMAIAAGLLVAADAPKDDPAKADLDKLQGPWNLVAAVRDGKEVPEGQVRRTTIVFTVDRFVFPMESGDATSKRGVIRVDPTKEPKEMDATSPEGEVSPGIYQVEGDDYKVCFAPPGRARPRKLTSEPGSGHLLQIWRRVKP